MIWAQTRRCWNSQPSAVRLPFGPETQRGDVVAHQGDVLRRCWHAQSTRSHPIAVLGRAARAQVPQDSAGIQQGGRFHDLGDHQVSEHLVTEPLDHLG